MPPVYTLEATDVPAPVVAATYLDPAGGAPTVAPTVTAYASGSGSLSTPVNRIAARLDALGRAGAGCYAVFRGLELSGTTVSGGVTVSAGQAVLDGVVTIASTVRSVSDNQTRIHLWIGQAGAITAVNNSLTPPSGAQAYLGSVVTSSGSITEINYSGRLTLGGAFPLRKTADTTTPADDAALSPDLRFLTQGPTELWFWDGAAYWSLSGSSGPIAIADGGTGGSTAAEARDNLSAQRVEGYALVVVGAADFTDLAGDYANFDFNVMAWDVLDALGSDAVVRLPNTPLSMRGRSWAMRNISNTYSAIFRTTGQGSGGATLPAGYSCMIYVDDALGVMRLTPNAPNTP